MTELTEKTALRESQVMQVMLLMFEDSNLTKKDACEKVGIPLSTFQYWVAKENSAVEQLRNFITMAQRSILFSTTLAELKLIERLIELASKSTTDARDVLAITKYLRDVSENLSAVHNTAPGNEAKAHAFLKEGPQTQKQTSKIASLEIEPTSEGGFRVGLVREDQIEDAEYTEKSQLDSSDNLN